MNGRQKHHLWLALRVRDLPLGALETVSAQKNSIAVCEKQRVVFCNTAARHDGIAEGMDLGTAQLLSGCRILSRDSRREEDTLEKLRDTLYGFTPHIDIHRSRYSYQSGLLLEISTCLRLFGGQEKFFQAIKAFLSTTDFDIRTGLAHTASGAWLLSFSRAEEVDDASRDIFIHRLNQLPIQVLFDYPKAVDALQKMGFSTLGDVASQIQSSAVGSLTKRLGKTFSAAISNIYGIDHDLSQAGLFSTPVPTYQPREFFQDRIRFDYPVTQVEQLKPAFETLLQNLCDFLRKRQWVCQQINWQVSDIYQQRDTFTVFSDLPQQGWQVLYDLTLITVENKPIPFEVDCLELICHDRLLLREKSRKLDFSGERHDRGGENELAVTLAKLKSRLGDNAVYKVSYRDSLFPETSQRAIGVAENALQQLPDVHQHSLRPAWLFDEPRSIEQRGQRLYWRGYLTLAVGPERLVGNWWEEAIARDYYLAHRQDNASFWVYQDLQSKGWFVHGVFS